MSIIVRVIFILLFVLIEFYGFWGLRTALSNPGERARQWITWGYWIVTIFFYLLTLYAFLTYSRVAGPSRMVYVVAGMFILLIVPKIMFFLVLGLEDIYRGFRALVIWIVSLTGDSSPGIWVGRRKFISQAAAIVAAIPFSSIIYGMVKGKYDFKVHKITLKFPNLPPQFHGFTITQLSDIHSGSFDNVDAVKRGVELANAQASDLLLFTGDIVNNKAEEMEEWIDVFKVLHAPYGKYSVFGNHDYGDYLDWPSAQAKRNNLDRLKEIHKEIGFRLMLNEHVKIEKNGAAITLVGIENWGLPPFPQYGNLTKAMNGVDSSSFKILMSHDPSHFDAEVTRFHEHIDLTLAGHTHGMQFGIEIPGIKWSPVKYRYPKWAGLYEAEKRLLYVNRGFGFLGFPGRVGIWPEITVIRLERA